ncbi:MAG: transposase [Solirubrobacterales bacterium]
MQSYCIPSALAALFRTFDACFTVPGFRHFVPLMTGWLLVRGPHTISRVLQVARRLGRSAHHASAYRFLSHGRWSLDAVGRVALELFRPWLPQRVLVIVDDTLCAKSGRQLFGVGIHHDATLSTYLRDGRRIDVCRPGHCWVVLAVHVPCPWDSGRGWAIPMLFRLYRPPARCPAASYRKRSELAVELIALLGSWLQDRRMDVTGDGAYCCKTVLRALPEQARFVGPLPLSAALYETVRPASRPGRPRRKGYRVASPRTRLAQRRGWETMELVMYGRPVCVQLFTCVCVWYPSAGTSPVRVVITRGRRGALDGRAYVSTDPDLSAKDVLATYARRWLLEVSFRDIKQELGFADPRNGWWRRPPGQRDDTCRRPLRRLGDTRGKKAVEHTAPLAAVAYALALRWYLESGRPALDVARARRRAPWYRHKRSVSFPDMLAALRTEILRDQFRRMRPGTRIRRISQKLCEMAGIAA